MQRYRATLENDRKLKSVGTELIDRFAPLPPEMEQLLKIVTIEILCREPNVEKVETGPKGNVMHFRDRSLAKLAGYIAD